MERPKEYVAYDHMRIRRKVMIHVLQYPFYDFLLKFNCKQHAAMPYCSIVPKEQRQFLHQMAICSVLFSLRLLERVVV